MSKVLHLFILVILFSLVHVSSQNDDKFLSFPLAESVKQMFDHSHKQYSEQSRAEFSAKLDAEASIKRSVSKTLDLQSGSWMLGDLTLYSKQCDQSILPFTQMKSTGSDITISHVIGNFQMKIGTIIQRPLSKLYNGILTYDGDSIPICFNFDNNGQLAFTSDFILCSSVDTFTPTCQTTSGTVYNIALLYKSPGTISGGSAAALIIGLILIALLCLCCCICCIVCIVRGSRRSETYGRLN